MTISFPFMESEQSSQKASFSVSFRNDIYLHAFRQFVMPGGNEYQGEEQCGMLSQLWLTEGTECFVPVVSR